MPREILLFLYVPNAPMEEIKREVVYVHGGSCTLEVWKTPLDSCPSVALPLGNPFVQEPHPTTFNLEHVPQPPQQ